MACLAIAVVFIVRIMGASKELFGTTIDVQVGWGLWMVGISSAALCVTSAVVAVQIGKVNEDYSRPSQAAWAGAWRWAAISASAVILLYAIVEASFSPITVNANPPANTESTPTQMVTVPTTLTVAPPTPGPRPTPASGPPPEAVPPYSTPCPANFANSEFGTSAVGSGVTSCEFAESVRSQFVHQAVRGRTVTVNAYSPVTQQTYLMSCSGNRVVTCIGGNNAVIYLY